MHGKTRPKKKVRKQLEYHSDSDEEPEKAEEKVEENVKNNNKAAKTPSKTPSKGSASLKHQPSLTKKHNAPTTSEPKAEGKKKGDKDKVVDTEAAFFAGGDKKSSGDEEEADSSDNEDEEDDEEEEDEHENQSGSQSESESDSDSGDDENNTDEDNDHEDNQKQRQVPKRNDPTAFATSMSKILATKLPTSARVDPLLSRSKAGIQASQELADGKLDKRVRAELRARKREELEKGHVTDTLGVNAGEAGETAELEKRLRKVAQRGVVKLFNAVRAAQVRGEELAREERRSRTTIGMGEREKHVNEISKQGFLDLINGDGKNKKTAIEEA